MKKIHFSIIIPTLNEARYLPKLLQDLASQSYLDFEVIVVDGDSKDKTIEIAKGFKDQLNLTILTSPRRHVCSQRNLGASHASGEFLLFCDADNRLPSYFLQGAKYRQESSSSDIVSFWLKPDVSNTQNDAIALAMNTFLELQNTLKPYFLLESLFLVSKIAFNTIGGFDESVNYSEGKTFIQTAQKLKLKSSVFRDPAYQFSFRRMRKFGALRTVANVALIELSSFFGVETNYQSLSKLYPMLGGSSFTKPKQVKNRFLKSISKLLRDF